MIFIILILSSIKTIKNSEEGLVIVLGNYKRKLGPGRHFVPPIISNVVKVNLNPLKLSIPSDEYISSDNSVLKVEAEAVIKVVDSEKSFFEIINYQESTKKVIMVTLRDIISDFTNKDVISKKYQIESKLKSNVNKSVKVWGVQVEEVQLVNPELIAKGKKGQEFVDSREFAIRIRDELSKHTEKFGIKIIKVDITGA
jgi:regulator of protease activity HflC (stomatin/prohibitin superfamily)